MYESRIRTMQVREHIGATVRLCGWIHAVRKLGRIAFVVVRDGWGTLQIVASKDALRPLSEANAGLESVVAVSGRLAANEEAPDGVELVDPTFEVIVAVRAPLPVPLGAGLEQAKLPSLLDHAATVLRDPSRRAVLEIAAAAVRGFRAMLEAEGFTEVFTPKIVESATESGANVFALRYFDREAYLAQSPQFYKQMMVGVFERVFEVAPVFRAEPHATVRHLSEYMSLDVELGFIRDHLDVVTVLRQVLERMLEEVQIGASSAVACVGARLPPIPAELPRIDFAEGRAMLASAGEGPLEAPDLAPAEERWLGQWARREHGSDWLVVTGYPLRKRPFYTHPDPARPQASNSFDLLFRGTELVTGGQRLHRIDEVEAALDAAGIGHELLDGYLEAFRYGMPPHGGFAIGLERFVAQLVGLPNVRLARAFPRDPHRMAP
jgi:nondiscriminating aspartyl-tRNA synthetase